MTNKETVLIFKLITTEYEKFDVSEEKVRLWTLMLKDIPFNVVQIAVMKLLASSSYAPKLHDVVATVAGLSIEGQNTLTSIEAWGEVTRAIRCFGQAREVEALESMTDLTRKTVKSMDFKAICNTPPDKMSFTRDQFLKCYEQLASRDREDRMLPAGLKNQITKLAGSFDIKRLGGGKDGGEEDID